MENSFMIIESNLNEVGQMLESHKSFLPNPMDSYCEDKLIESTICRIVQDRADIGYVDIIQDELRYFHVFLASLITVRKSFRVALLGKEELTLRTGNPPGELV